MRIALLALLAFLCGCGAGGGAKPAQRLRIALLGPGLQSWCLALPLADSLSYFKQEGVEVRFETLPSTSKGLEALLGGSVDVGGLVYPQAIQMAADGQRVRSVFVMSKRLTQVFLVAPAFQDKVRRVEDLKGLNVGIPSAGSANDQWLGVYLGVHGMKRSDVNTVATGMGGTAIAAIENGRLAAAVVTGGTHFELLRRHPGLRILADGSSPEGMRETFGSENYAGGAMLARQDWIDRHPDAIRRMNRALARAQQWIGSHTVEEVEAQLPEGFRWKDRAVNLAILRWSAGWYTADGRMPPGAPEDTRRYLGLSIEKVRDAKIDLAATWTDEFLEAAK